MYQDKMLICKDCGKEFVWTAGEQEFFAEKGFANEPKRCKACREAKKRGSSPLRTSRETYDAVCAACGRPCKVPFEPAGDRPVYCGECFAKLKASVK
jgi:CxxC-x17-CxxC domain-containing protein